jgi:hypothetical protein
VREDDEDTNQATSVDGMRDRLSEIQKPSRLLRREASHESDSLVEEISHPFFTGFFDSVEIIKNGCRSIELAASALDSLNDASAGLKESNEDTLDRVIAETNQKIQQIHKLLHRQVPRPR